MTTGGQPQSPDPYTERRSSPREATDLPVLYSAGGEPIAGTMMDLGMGGLGLAGPTQFPVGTEIELRFGVRGDGSPAAVTIKAKVRHSQPGKMGVAFINVQASDQRRRFELIKQLAAAGRRG